MTCKKPIHGAWVVTRTCPWDGTIITMGLFPEHKAALKRLEHIMDDPADNEEYKLEYQVFSSYEQELEKHQACLQNCAEWMKRVGFTITTSKNRKNKKRLLSLILDSLLQSFGIG